MSLIVVLGVKDRASVLKIRTKPILDEIDYTARVAEHEVNRAPAGLCRRPNHGFFWRRA
ncbi:hypothetical protein PT2222_170010 [Paraburkholderia tropica]